MKVSVLINNYNYAPYIDDCINSLLNQTYKNIEIIFYDDGSKDNSVEVVRKYEDKVTIIANPNFGHKPGLNQANSINRAFEKSTGDIICLLDSDDFFSADKIEKVVGAFEKNADAVLVQHAFFLYVNQEITGKQSFARDMDYLLLYKKKRWTGFFNPTSTLSFRREYLNKLLPLKIDDNWRVWPDVRLARVAPYFGKVIVINEPLSYYRRHGSNDSAAMNKKSVITLKNQVAHHKYINKFLKERKQKPINYFLSVQFIRFCLQCISFK